MTDDLLSRRARAAAIARERRGQLGITQEELARRADVAVRTIQSLESHTRPRWPNAVTRARIEKALGWLPGELDRLASPPSPIINDPQWVGRLRELTADEREWSIWFLQGLQDAAEKDRSRRRGG